MADQAGALTVIGLFPTSGVDIALYQALLGDTHVAEQSLIKAEQRVTPLKLPSLPSMKAFVRAVLDCRAGRPEGAARLLDEHWAEHEALLTGDILRPLRIVGAFAIAVSGPRNAGIAAGHCGLMSNRPAADHRACAPGVARPSASRSCDSSLRVISHVESLLCCVRFCITTRSSLHSASPLQRPQVAALSWNITCGLGRGPKNARAAPSTSPTSSADIICRCIALLPAPPPATGVAGPYHASQSSQNGSRALARASPAAIPAAINSSTPHKIHAAVPSNASPWSSFELARLIRTPSRAASSR